METKACWEAAHPNLARESTHHTLMYSDKVYRFRCPFPPTLTNFFRLVLSILAKPTTVTSLRALRQ